MARTIGTYYENRILGGILGIIYLGLATSGRRIKSVVMEVAVPLKLEAMHIKSCQQSRFAPKYYPAAPSLYKKKLC
jgi:hypothetical protein